MTYTKFKEETTHDQKVDLLIRSVTYLDNDCYHDKDSFKRGYEIATSEEVQRFMTCKFLKLNTIDGELTGLSDYQYYLVIGNDGTTFLIQDLLGR